MNHFYEHTEEIITALKNTTQKKLDQMGKNLWMAIKQIISIFVVFATS